MVNSDNINNSLRCFWCHHNFKGNGIGCPIKFVNNKIKKCYYSEITKDNYEIVGKISDNELGNIEKTKEIQLLDNCYYLVDGIFCSFNCCLAFINDNNKNMLYDNSKHLLYKMYMTCFPDNIDTQIFAAPHWKLLIDYGGHLTIDEFRDNFNKIIYKDLDLYRSFNISWLHEENVKF